MDFRWRSHQNPSKSKTRNFDGKSKENVAGQLIMNEMCHKVLHMLTLMYSNILLCVFTCLEHHTTVYNSKHFQNYKYFGPKMSQKSQRLLIYNMIY